MSGSKTWTATDRTGGPVDEVFDQLRARIPGLVIERLTVKHRADDDNVYFISDERGYGRVQLDTFPGGAPTFYIENGGRLQTDDLGEATDIICICLEQSHPPGTSRQTGQADES